MPDDIEEHQVVRLVKEWLATATFPEGLTGTVVHIHNLPDAAANEYLLPSGRAYAVEFCDLDGRGVIIDLPAYMVERVP